MESLNSATIFDLVVIGAGPAGTSAAVTAVREGLSVALLEAGSFPRHKVCGEFISGEALQIMESLATKSARSAITITSFAIVCSQVSLLTVSVTVYAPGTE